MGYEIIEAVPLIGALGAEIRGLDLAKPIDDATFAEIERAFLEYQAICFRGQKLTPDDQLAFAARFGEIDTYPFVQPLEGYEGIVPIVKEPETRINFGGGWHTDTSYMPQPPKATLLYGVDIPERGGDTMFSNTYAAYDDLSDGLKQLLEGRTAVFTASAVHGARGAYSHVKAGDVKRRQDESQAELRVEHPVFRTHPDTGRKAIYVGRFHVERLSGMRVDESAPLLSFLTSHAVKPEYTMRFQWEPGTVLIWDNRCVQHNALNDYPGQRREVHRVTIKGDTPF
ncbi:MAG: TauD/TfdA family dioxygenase [Deltaproteobacteria bacterium]|nr:TauD/TfdA family dioxygenase [Deltaproteobacteria bacterium]